jgi:tetratricopeptide (TPR) repeat protein
MWTSMRTDIFLSCSTRNTSEQQRLIFDAHARLEACYGSGHVFLAPASIPSHDEWEPRVHTALDECRVGVIVLSAAALGARDNDFSDWVLKEATILKFRRDKDESFKLLILAFHDVDAARLKEPPWGPLGLERIQLHILGADATAATFADAIVNAVGNLRSQPTSDGPKERAVRVERLLAFGNRCLKDKNFSGAVYAFTQALRDNPELVAARLERGLAFCALGRYQEAEQDLSKALELDPQHPYALFNRGMTYHHLGMPSQACADWRKVKALGFPIADGWIDKLCDCS